MVKEDKRLFKIAIDAAVKAGKSIMEIYESGNFEIENKTDDSPLTLADKTANKVINNFLVPTEIPIISEENKQLPYEVRKSWKRCWIVDPLDGTKEFIKKNGEFTVNIALVEEGKPILGVIFAPALYTIYFGMVEEKKGFRATEVSFQDSAETILRNSTEIIPHPSEKTVNIVGSRSHMNKDTLEFIEDLKREGKNVEVVSKGSSLKFCLVAEGSAQIYPRFAPTMEWDTAAGQAICESVGLKCLLKDTGKPMIYNRENFLNDHFAVSHEG